MSAANQPYTESQKDMIQRFNAAIREGQSSFAAPTGSVRPWTHEQETAEILRPARRTEDMNGVPYCRGCGMMASQCDCWDTVNGGM